MDRKIEKYRLKRWIPIWKGGKMIALGIPSTTTYQEVEESHEIYNQLEHLIQKGILLYNNLALGHFLIF